MVRGEASGQRVPGFYSRQEHLLYLAFEWGGRPGGPAQNISDVGGGRGQDTLEFLHLTLRTSDYLSVNSSLPHKMHILFR